MLEIQNDIKAIKPLLPLNYAAFAVKISKVWPRSMTKSFSCDSYLGIFGGIFYSEMKGLVHSYVL